MNLPTGYRPPTTAHLLHRILESPDLLAGIRRLPGTTLARLVSRVGLEDAGELVALASNEQLCSMFDQDLFQSAEAGGDEHFDAGRFALWLSVIAESGDDFVVRCLTGMSVDLLTHAVHQLVLVLDMDQLAMATGLMYGDTGELDKALESRAYEEWQEFRLIARDEAAWEVVLSALLLLDREHHDLLREILERCCILSNELLAEYDYLHEVLTSDQALAVEVMDQRESRRAEQGFVSAADARAFLALAQSGADLHSRDAIAKAYFRNLNPQEQPVAEGSVAHSSENGTDERRSTDAWQRLLSQADLHQEGRPLPAALTAGAAADHDGCVPTYLQLWAPVLDGKRHAELLEELGFLANVLLAKCRVGAESKRPIEALEAAVAVCNVGVHVWLDRFATNPEEPLAVLQQVGADQLFRCGLRHLQAGKVMGPLAAVLHDWLPLLTT